MHTTITERVVLVGGPRISDGQDCLVYALDLGELVLIDCGAGPSWPRIRENVERAGMAPADLHTLVLTHCHIDHIGAAAAVVSETGCRVVAHRLDAEAIESGDPIRTASSWYGLDLDPVEVTEKVDGEELTIAFSAGDLRLIHTPGHTPGSLVGVVDDAGERVLFGQDIHGPFSHEFGSDLEAWRRSMTRVLELEADILCEGHYGVFRPADAVRGFIEGQLASH